MLRAIILFVFFSNITFGQNLVPNPSFEKHNKFKVNDWQQPLGYFYHYQSNNDVEIAEEGSFFNSICLNNFEENEYLHVRLKEKLEAGRKYCLSMYIQANRTITSTRPLKEIGWHFTDYPVEVNQKVKIKLNDSPVIFKIDSINSKEWKHLDTIYTATGNEEYLTIGYFFYKANDSINILKWNLIDSIEKAKKNALTDYDDSLNSKELHAIKLDKIKNKKKFKKGYKDETFKILLKERQDKIKEIENIYNLQIDEIKKKFQSYEKLYIRVNLDEICITPLMSGVCSCDSLIKEQNLKTGDIITIKNIEFEKNKAELLDISFAELNNLVKTMNENPSMIIEIRGHTDNDGSDELNNLLSENRAKAVVIYLISNGISPDRLTYKGYGSTLPLAENNSETGKGKNRRVEFLIIKK